MCRAKIIELDVKGSDSGSLVAIEEKDTIPFDIKRIFYIYGVRGSATRGNHANRKSEMLMIASSGEVKVTVDDGDVKQEFLLDSPSKALYLPKMTWKSMKSFSSDCVLMVLANEHYDESEYIVNYEEFKKEVE